MKKIITGIVLGLIACVAIGCTNDDIPSVDAPTTNTETTTESTTEITTIITPTETTFVSTLTTTVTQGETEVITTTVNSTSTQETTTSNESTEEISDVVTEKAPSFNKIFNAPPRAFALEVETTEVDISTTEETTMTIKETNSTETSLTSTATTTTIVTTTTTEISTTAVETTTSLPREYVVYKPGTHYVHKNTCRWVDNTCYEIDTTNGLECLYCTECKPDIKIVTPYVKPKVQSASVSDSDYILLCNCVAYEAGSNEITAYNKALVVEVIMNRVKSSAYPNTVYGVITQKGQFSGCWNYANLTTYSSKVTEKVKEGVNMYFDNPSSFNHGYTGFWGDGHQNHFR